MPYVLLICAAIFWGGNYVIGRVLVEHADPILMTQARWLLTAVMLLFLYFRQLTRQWQAITHSFKSIVFLALFGQVLFPLTLYIGLQTTTSLNAAIYMSATPSVVLIINWLVFRDNITRNNVYGVVLSSLGVIFLIMHGDLGNLAVFTHLNHGDLWAMGSALSWAFYCSFLRTKDKTISSNAFVTVSSVIGAVMLIPIVWCYCLTQAHVDLSAYSNGSFWLGLTYLVLFPSWLSYVFWNKGISEIGATRGEIYTHIIPLSGGLLSIGFLDVQFEYYHFVSAVMIALGIWLCSKKQCPTVNRAVHLQNR